MFLNYYAMYVFHGAMQIFLFALLASMLVKQRRSFQISYIEITSRSSTNRVTAASHARLSSAIRKLTICTAVCIISDDACIAINHALICLYLRKELLFLPYDFTIFFNILILTFVYNNNVLCQFRNRGRSA